LIDGRLTGFYTVPFPAIGDSPATPSVIEQIARYMAVSDCLNHLSLINADEPSTYMEQATDLLEDVANGKVRPDTFNLTAVRVGELQREEQVTQYDYMYAGS
jgi:hypothetical protein